MTHKHMWCHNDIHIWRHNDTSQTLISEFCEKASAERHRADDDVADDDVDDDDAVMHQELITTHSDLLSTDSINCSTQVLYNTDW